MRLRTREKDHTRKAVAALYATAVDAARQPKFYADMGVPDSVDGRYEMIVMHVFFLVRVLRRDPEQGGAVAQSLFDLMFADMDQSLREMGAGDLGVGKKVQRMAKAFYGRARAYEAAMAVGDSAVREALQRNLYGTVDPTTEHLDAMCEYVLSTARSVESTPRDRLIDGSFLFERN